LLNSATARTVLQNTGSPQQDAPGRQATQRIGNRPNLAQLIPAVVKQNDKTVDMIAVMGADGNLQVICIANDGLLYLIWQDKAGRWYYYGQLPAMY